MDRVLRDVVYEYSPPGSVHELPTVNFGEILATVQRAITDGGD